VPQPKPAPRVPSAQASEHATRVHRAMIQSDQYTGAPDTPCTAPSMTLKRLGRLTVAGRSGSKTVRKLCAYVPPEVATATIANARDVGLTISDYVAEALDAWNRQQ
jgi:hypothetical protein